jgi:2-amino-4-hydroxy-6-hydroxymethyldihydropteridine diphosphokinase
MIDGENKHLAFLGLGTNLGDRRKNLARVLALLDKEKGIRVDEVSSVYESEPWGVIDQPGFLNMVARVSTTRDPRSLLAACTEIEAELGRVRDRKWGPRVIDVDILLFDDLEMEEEGLTIPHPHMLEREFVMVPLLELQADIVIPGTDGTATCYPAGGEGKVAKAFRLGKEEWHGEEG